MKILHISKYYPPYRGGIEDICYSIVSTMKKMYDQRVICFNDKPENCSSKVDNIVVDRIGCFTEIASQPISFSFYRKLKSCLKDFNPDIIHFHLPNPLICLYVLLLIPRRTKLILHWHSDIVAQKIIYRLFSPIEKKILRRADHIIVTCPQYLQGSIPLSKYKDKSIVIPNVVSLEKLEIKGKEADIEKLKNKFGKPIVFFMGRHVPYKGIEYLLESEKYIVSDCVILIAGSGPLTKDLKNKTKSERIKFIGRIDDEDIPLYMSAADVFAFPSITKNEAFGVVLAEAMYCKAVPVTFTIKGSGVNWVNINKETGLEVENKNSKEFAKAIDLLIQNDDLRCKYSENAKKRVINEFTIDTIKSKLIEIYNS